MWALVTKSVTRTSNCAFYNSIKETFSTIIGRGKYWAIFKAGIYIFPQTIPRIATAGKKGVNIIRKPYENATEYRIASQVLISSVWNKQWKNDLTRCCSPLLFPSWIRISNVGFAGQGITYPIFPRKIDHCHIPGESIQVTLEYARKITHAGCSLRTLRRSRNLFRNFSALSLASGESGWLATARATT